jgi:hypothetical protein
MDILLALTATSQAIDIVNKIRSVDKSLEKAELKANMAELYEKLADVKMALTDAKVEISTLESTIETLKEGIRFKQELVEVDGFKYAKDEKGEATGIPFCPACEATKGIFVRITFPPFINERCCPVCRFVFGRAAKRLGAPD